MPKINVYVPDELAEAVRAAGVPVSAVCQRALEQAVRRITAIRETALNRPGDDPAAQFSQFTDRARAVVQLAWEQARAAGATSVGTEHLLGGILAEGGNLALSVLRALEIAPAQVQRELARMTDASGDDGEAQFSVAAANALELTITEAVMLGHNYVGCEHLLLGLIAEPEGTAGHVLRGLGAEQRLTRRAVAAALAGYVHLRAQSQPATGDERSAGVTALVQQQLRPIIERLDRLEERSAQR
jgi:ATP-dependent Clp protease ATP-binding subunit ClpA